MNRVPTASPVSAPIACFDRRIEAVERRRKDPEFKKILKKTIERDRELLERLAR